jgi:cell division inhibitor SepF
MSNFWVKFKELAGIEEIEAETESDEEKNPHNGGDRTPVTVRSQYGVGRSVKPELREVDPKDKVISIHQTLNAITSRFNLVVTEPSCFDECPKLVDSLKARKPIIINLEKVETDVARKIFDFLSGATYALNGNMQKIANNIFVFVPENVNVSTTPEHTGIDFGPGTKSPWR